MVRKHGKNPFSILGEQTSRMEAIDESLSILQQLANLTIGTAEQHQQQAEEEEEEQLPRQMVKIRDDQVQNNAGGYVFKVDDLARIRRFLILGTSGGTYYVNQKELTIENTATIMECIREGKGGIVLREIIDISLAGRAPKQDPLLFALALCARYNVKDRKKLLSHESTGDGKKKQIKEEIKKKKIKEAVEEKMEEDKPAEKKTYATAVGKNKAEVEEKKEKEEEKCDDPKFEQYMIELQTTAMKAVAKVCRIPTHLFQFVKYCELIANSTSKKRGPGGGWSRAMRKCIAEWYLQKSPKELAMHLTKYPSREGWSHRDLLRLSHPMASQSHQQKNDKKRKKEMGKDDENDEDLTLVYDQMFHYACTGEFDEKKSKMEQADPSTTTADDSKPLIKKSRCDYSLNQSMLKCAESSEALEFIRRVKEASQLNEENEGENRCAELIRQFGLVREHVPTKLLNSKTVWIALLEKMPMTALLRNLSKLGTLGLLDEAEPENKPHIDSVCTKLANEEAIHRARIHPISVLLAASVYKQGHGVKGKLSWKPNERVVQALDQMFLLAFKNVQPTGKRYCLALDVSGSMESPINGGVLSCREASAAMANVFLRTEEKVECVSFESELTPLPFTRETSVTKMVEYIDGLDFGSTDCALPMVWAKKERKEFDCFIVFTDNETWSGNIHPFEALRQYRQAMDIPDAKLAVMGMTATEFTIADPNDRGMMDLVGLDAAIPELLRAFVLNEF